MVRVLLWVIMEYHEINDSNIKFSESGKNTNSKIKQIGTLLP